MALKSGQQYLDSLNDGREVWHRGQRVDDVTTAPGLGRAAHTIGALMQRQLEPDYQTRVTYERDGKRFATSFLNPGNREDIVARA